MTRLRTWGRGYDNRPDGPWRQAVPRIAAAVSSRRVRSRAASRRRLAATDAAARNRLPAPAAPRKRRGWGRPIGIVVLVLLLVVVVWAVASYVVLGRAVDGANAGSARSALDQQSGLALNEPTTTLLLGTDHGPGAGRESARRSDSMLLIRTDPERGRTRSSRSRATSASRCRARGFSKINAAYQSGDRPHRAHDRNCSGTASPSTTSWSSTSTTSSG